MAGNKKEKNTKGTVTKVTDSEARKEALLTALKGIRKDFGEGSIMKLGENKGANVEVYPTGILSIDAALGVGGLPKGRIIEIYGPESSGKTTLALHAVASCQKLGGTAAFIDAEHAMDPSYAEKIGVDINEIYVSQPDSGEQALDIAEALIRSGAIDMVVIDSVAALVPKAEIEGDMGDAHVGLQARLMSQALRKLTAIVSNTNCVVIFINQLREKVGVLYGNPETTTGGKALKFYSTIRIDVRKSEPIKEGKELVGNRTKIKIVKNKVAPPFKSVVVDMLYGQGISKYGDMLDIAVNMNIITKSGSFYSYEGERIAQGRDPARKWLETNPDKADAIEAKIREEMAKNSSAVGNGKVVAETADTSDDSEDDGEFELDDDTEVAAAPAVPSNAPAATDSTASPAAGVSTESDEDKAYWDEALGMNK